MPYTNSDLSISVVENLKINSTFVKANNHILTKYAHQFKDINEELKLKTLKECWIAEFRAELDINDLTILFQRKKDMTMFLLTWT